jgi:ABC-type transport system involved in multi-copper enzyme maturation permease subunit
LLKDQYSNEALNDIVTNRLESEKVLKYKNELFRKDNPIFLSSKDPMFFSSHFYAPSKNFFGIQLSTFWANIIVLWIFVVISFIALYFDWLRKLLMTVGYWKNRIQKKPLA